MEGDIVSAGTFVASVLEHAGYLTQARFMESFRDFFRDAGALVYFIGAVGGLISLMMFGSFRAAQYLLIGPALYWFLVGPTTDVQGVVSKLGDGTPRGFIGEVGLDSAKKDRDAVIQKSGENPTQNIKIAEGFWLFVKPINDFVEEFVGIMLKNEDESDLAVASKVRGLEMVARSLPSDQGTIHLLENEILKNCIENYSQAFGAAQNYIKSTITQGISSKNAAVDRTKHKESFDIASKKFLQSAQNTSISINATDTPILKSLIEQHGKSGSGSRLLSSFYLANEESAAPKILCSDGWNIYLERIWHLSTKKLPVLLRLASGEWTGPKAEEEACSELTRKFYDDLPGGQGAAQVQGGECDLRPAISLALLWNHMSRRDTFQKVLGRHSTDRDPLNSRNQAAVVALSSLGNKVGQDLAANPELHALTNAVGGTVLTMGVAAVRKLSDSTNKYEAVADWAPAATLNLIQGLNQSEQIDLPIYEMTRLRQQIFTWAMQLPYFQGLLLYMIAVAYPFAALIVLLPGRAPGFLNIPLAWLWVKSWDIGFAAIILLEKVMYNMLPNWSVNPALRQGPWTYEKLPMVLGEGYNFGHVQAVGYHYTILSMVTLAMPGIMAAFTIKGKKAILSNFVDAVSNQARDAGSRASGAHSISASNERAQLLFSLGGFAKQAPAFGLGGVEGGLKGTVGGAVAAMNMVPSLAKSALDTSGAVVKPGDLPKTAIGVLGKSGQEYLERYKGAVVGQADFERDYRAAFDPMYGRWGVLQMSSDAAAAALDGAGARVSGGFESNQPKINAVDAYMSLNKAQFDTMLGAEKTLGEIQGKAINNIISQLGSVKDFVDKPVGQTSSLFLNIAGASVINEQIEKVIAGNMIGIARDSVEKYTEGFDKNVAWAKMWGVNPELLKDPDIKRAIDEEVAKGNFSAHLYSQIYNTATSIRNEESEKFKGIPGGANTYLDPIIEGLGGNRTVIEVQNPNSITIPPPENRGGFISDMYETLSTNPVMKSFGFEPADTLFLQMQQDKEKHEIKNTPQVHEHRLETMLGKTLSLEIFSDLNSHAPVQQQVKDIIDKAKLTVEVDRSNGVLGSVVPIPSGIENLANENPITALEAIHTWHRKWQNNNEKHNLQESSENYDAMYFNSNQILSKPYKK